jgi:hypothetical protein
MMKLFAIYIGGSTDRSLIELHDMRFVIADSIENTHDDLKAGWWGTPDSLHIDCYGELVSTDGYNIHLRKEPSVGDEKLYFVNLGAYDPQDFTELHKNVFVIAPTESKAKVKALKIIQDWGAHHVDFMYDIEKMFCLNDIAREKSLYIHLEKTDKPEPFEFVCKYMPLDKEKA